MKKYLLGSLMTALTLAAASGCGSSRDVTVSGSVADASPNMANGPIRLEFYEPGGGADAGASTGLKLVDSTTLTAPGPFQQTVSLSGSKLVVVAVLDANASDTCTDGEAWGESSATVAADDAVNVSVNIVPQTRCPAIAAE